MIKSKNYCKLRSGGSGDVGKGRGHEEERDGEGIAERELKEMSLSSWESCFGP